MSKSNKKMDVVDGDMVEEIRDGVVYALECRNWVEVEDVLELLNEVLGYDAKNEDEDDKRNHLEE